MKIIKFSKYFLLTAIFSIILCLFGLTGYIYFLVRDGSGFNMGVDFQAGLIQEVQFAPKAFGITWSGRGTASVSFDRNNIYIVISGAGVEGRTVPFTLSAYGSLSELLSGMKAQVEGIDFVDQSPDMVNPQWLLHSAQGNPQLSSEPYVVHYLAPGSEEISIVTVREALIPLGKTVSVQSVGAPEDRHFMIRLEDSEIGSEGGVPADRIIDALENYPGLGSVAVLRSDYVGSRFSKNLSDQAGILMALTLALILIYASIRFKPQYAVGAVVAIIHDAIITAAFVAWSRMEFNTTTIAAILTILGYSINDTIVIFDRIRETRRIYPDDSFVDVLNRGISETLSRTIITTITTMLAVLSLFIFTTGSMKDFAACLLVGMISGVYSTIFIASGIVNFWEDVKIKRARKRLAG
ncbi:MAG: protein translocase subunit SecF [Treponema sp.]|jgi:preprotein translocase subunit SecF|nr:protein translocase subunit SecF [Treponema sp.]